jgi:hypothetical protein
LRFCQPGQGWWAGPSLGRLDGIFGAPARTKGSELCMREELRLNAAMETGQNRVRRATDGWKRGMGDRELMRASDDDREQVVGRLRAALEDGRLKIEEFTERVGLAYQAVTYGDLAKLHADLPAASPEPEPQPAPASAAPPAVTAKRSAFADLPAPLKVLWTIWLAAVSINVVVWVLVVGTSGHLIYPWPLWVAGPFGAALLAVSVPVVHSRRSRRVAATLPSPGEADSRRQLGS